MNQIFDLNRFGRYFSYISKVGSRKYFAYAGGAFGILLIIELWQILIGKIYSFDYYSTEDPMWTTEFWMFLLAFFGFITLAGSMIFADMGDKSMRLSALMVPASQFEKFIARLIVVLPITMVVCFVGFEVVDLIRYVVGKIYYPEAQCIHPIGLAKDFFMADAVKVYFGVLLAIQSIFVLGGIVWPKTSWLKTLGAIFVLGAIYSLISFWLGEFILTNTNMHYSIENYRWVMDFGVENLVLIAGCIMALVNYTVAYMRLTEIELVQRW